MEKAANVRAAGTSPWCGGARSKRASWCRRCAGSPERTFAWRNSWRRLALDLERYAQTMRALVFFRMANLLATRLAPE